MKKTSIHMHPSSEMLFNHAMGNSSEAESLIIQGHIAYCSACKAEIAKYENIGGNYLNNNDITNISNGLLDKILDEIDDTVQHPIEKNYTDHKISSSLTNNPIRVPSFISDYLYSKKKY
jgi:anti-sigma factor ChrR (cupin superfamily)